jgi:DNA-binding NarL/FixJ family response regulator
MPTRVCVIGDETGACRILEGILDSSKGAFSCVGTYATAEEALQGIPDAKPQVLLVDVGLPGISGVELTRRAKKSWPQVKIIIITGCTELKIFWQAVQAGADGYLTKPIRPLEVFAAMEQVMSGGGPPMSAGLFENSFLRSSGTGSHISISAVTNRDGYLLALASDGMTDKEIAMLTRVSGFTVNDRWKSIFHKLNVHNRGAAITLWLKHI